MSARCPQGVVDGPFPESEIPCSDGRKEPTHKSARVAVQRQPGPRRTEGTDRLMATVPPRIDAAPPALCPLCGTPADGHSTVRREGLVVTGNYICPNEHVWLERWAEPMGRD